MITFAQYKNGNANIIDYLNKWNEINLPKEIEEEFNFDKYIRGLHQSNYNLYKNNIVVEFSIIHGDVNIIIYKDDSDDWVLVRYENNKYNCITFVKEEDKLLYIIKNQLEVKFGDSNEK